MDGRQSARWMVQLDERIMEYIDREGWASPGLLASERGFPESKGRIEDRCLRLHYAGFIEPFADEMFDLTVEGRLYLDGEIDAEHQPTPAASVVFNRQAALTGLNRTVSLHRGGILET